MVPVKGGMRLGRFLLGGGCASGTSGPVGTGAGEPPCDLGRPLMSPWPMLSLARLARRWALAGTLVGPCSSLDGRTAQGNGPTGPERIRTQVKAHQDAQAKGREAADTARVILITVSPGR